MTSRASLRSLVKEVNGQLSGRDFGALNARLESADFKTMEPEMIMGLLRSTVTSRGRLPSWDGAVARAASELDARNLPTNEILAGLLNIS